MARIRTIKPEFFTSDTVSQLPMRTRLTWIGLWTHSDDYGRSRDNVKLIKAAVWPLDDVSNRDIEIDLNTLADRGLIFRYAVDGKSYIQVTSWTEHQKVDRPSKSPIPAPLKGTPVNVSNLKDSCKPNTPPEPVDNPDNSSSTHTREAIAKDSRALATNSIGKGKERKGKEGSEIASPRESPPATNDPGPKPPPKCPEHQNDPDPPPCGRCKDARRALATWEQQTVAATSTARSETARAHAELVRADIDKCQLCDHDGQRGGTVCSHDPNAAERARRGKAAALAALKRPAS